MSPKFLCALCAILLATTSHAAPNKPAIAAKSNIDARGVAALDRSIAYYQKQRSFSCVATELMVLDGEAPRRARYRINLQAPYRASLQAVAVNAQGKTIRQVTSRLINNEFYYASEFGGAARVQFIGSAPEARRKALVQLFRILPASGVSLVSLAGGENPALQKMISRVSYGEIRDGARTLKAVTLSITEPTALSIELGLSPQTFAVERVVIRGNSGGQKLTTITRFDKLVANWKNSQIKTDASVYNWQKLPLQVPFEIIDPKARAVLARAVGFYEKVDALHFAWKTHQDNANEIGAFDDFTSSLDFERSGSISIRNGNPHTDIPLRIIAQGTSRVLLDENYEDEGGKVFHYTVRKVDKNPLKALEPISDDLPEPAMLLIDWLKGQQMFDEPAKVEELQGYGLTGFRVLLMSPQTVQGEICDIVRQSSLSDEQAAGIEVNSAFHTFYWFARSDGRLLRIQEQGQIEGAPAHYYEDTQITAQQINPTFAPDTFKFVAPKGAVLTKN